MIFVEVIFAAIAYVSIIQHTLKIKEFLNESYAADYILKDLLECRVKEIKYAIKYLSFMSFVFIILTFAYYFFKHII